MAWSTHQARNTSPSIRTGYPRLAIISADLKPPTLVHNQAFRQRIDIYIQLSRRYGVPVAPMSQTATVHIFSMPAGDTAKQSEVVPRLLFHSIGPDVQAVALVVLTKEIAHLCWPRISKRRVSPLSSQSIRPCTAAAAIAGRRWGTT